MYAVNDLVDPLSPLQRTALATAQSFIPLKSLRHGFLEELFIHVEPQSIIEGETLFEAGAIDGQCIYLSAGSVELEYPSGRTVCIQGDAALEPLGHQQPRPCKAVAKQDCLVLRIDLDRLERTLSWSQMTDYMLSELSFNRENDGDLDWLKTVLSSNLFFKVPSVNAEMILQRLTPINVEIGEEIIREGERGDCCYFLKQGRADILKKSSKDIPSSPDEPQSLEKVAEILPGRCFGEDALLDSRPRNASVVMSEPGVLMRLDKEDFFQLLQEPLVEEVSIQQVDELRDAPILIDVRTDAEYRMGHLAYSANIPLSILALKKRLLAMEKSYVLYCDTGRRSRAAAYFLGKEGYNVIALEGGILKQGLSEHIVQQPSHILREGELAESQDFS